MEYITVSAKDLDDAITEALVELGVTSDQLDYEVIEKGSAGFLGIGMKQAVIRARRKEPEPEEEPIVEEIITETVVDTAPEEENPSSSEEHREHKRSRSRNRNRHKEKHSEYGQETEATEDTGEAAVSEAPVHKEVELAKVEDATMEACVSFIKNVLDAMDMKDVEVTACVDDEGALSIDMEGSNMGILIGKRGQTLDSLQYLANRVANKAQDGYVRVKLDTEDYRRRRKATLENLARNIASKVKRTRKTVALEPMNPYERRIIHSALQSDPAVVTHSEGEEPYRRVVVTLAHK